VVVAECLVVLALTVTYDKKGTPTSLSAKPVPCKVVKRNWKRWVREGRVFATKRTYYLNTGLKEW